MKYSLFPALGIVILFLCSGVCNATILDDVQDTQHIIEIDTTEAPLYENRTIISTYGPITPRLEIADIVLIDGPIFKTQVISYLLENRNLQFLLPYITIDIQDLTFSVRYSKTIPDVPIARNFQYSTFIEEDGIYQLYNTSHTVIVTGFDGQFLLTRVKPFRFMPSYFFFAGECDTVLIVA